MATRFVVNPVPRDFNGVDNGREGFLAVVIRGVVHLLRIGIIWHGTSDVREKESEDECSEVDHCNGARVQKITGAGLKMMRTSGKGISSLFLYPKLDWCSLDPTLCASTLTKMNPNRPSPAACQTNANASDSTDHIHRIGN